MQKKPIGVITRGKTADNRLRRADNFILLYEPSLLTRQDGEFEDALFVDVGYGFDPRTTLESAARFRALNPRLKILGVEIDKGRVEAAQPFADGQTFFRLGGFNLPLQSGERTRLIRAFNVLRQYHEEEFAPACETLASYLLPGGLLLEGTSNPSGGVWVANLIRRPSTCNLPPVTLKPIFEALVFSTNFHAGFDLTDFQAVLPKNFIHRVTPGELIYDFFEAWKRSANETIAARPFGLRQWFAAAARSLHQKGYTIDLHKKWIQKGFLVWRR
ncbi:MAG: hypothetical protein Fur002_21760 [Anaerolineales bacterium]